MATNNSNKKNLGLIAFALLLVGGGATGAYYLTKNNQPIEGFEGVGETLDTLSNVEVANVDPLFDIARISAIRDQICAGTPIEDIESFKKAFETNVKQAEENHSSTIVIPSVQAMFELAKGDLTINAQNLIAEYAKAYLKTNTQSTIIVEGYACNIGSDEVNDKISIERAKAVKDALICNGVPAGKIETKWFGKKKYNEYHFATKEEHRRATINIK